jgi:hypothetical protein
VDLDEDLVLTAKQLAEQRGMTMGQTISLLMRQALQPAASPRVRNGVRLLSPKKDAKRPGMSLVNQLRDEE